MLLNAGVVTLALGKHTPLFLPLPIVPLVHLFCCSSVGGCCLSWWKGAWPNYSNFYIGTYIQITLLILSEAGEKIIRWWQMGCLRDWLIGWRGSGEQLRTGFETPSTGTGAAGNKPPVATFCWSARCVSAHVIHSFKSSGFLSYATTE